MTLEQDHNFSTWNLKDHVDSVETKYDGLFLGRLVWYSISEQMEISHTEFNAKALKAFYGLEDQPDIPGFPRPTDVFKRGCTQSQRKNVETEDENVRLNYMTRPTGFDKDVVWRTIVREKVDSEGHTLGYDELVRVTFHREDETIRFEDLTIAEDDDNVESIKTYIKTYYKEEIDKITPYAVREFVRKCLERTIFATKVRPSGGIYFVPEEYGPAVDALDNLLNDLGEASSFHYLPLPDDSKQREMLRVAFEDESVYAMDKLIAEMVEVLKSNKKISTDRFASMKLEYDNLLKKVGDYSELLDEKMETSSNRLLILKKVLVKTLNTSVKSR